jgi:phosphoribosylanthranilate isomerase
MPISPVMRTRVKICGITRASDAIAAAQAGADAIGLVFWPGTQRLLSAPAARAIAATLPPFLSTVGLFVDPDAAEVRATLDAVRLDVLQFHGDEPPEFCRAFARPYIKAIPVHAGLDTSRLLECARRYADAVALLFDAPPSAGMPGGTGTTFDWDLLPRGLERPVVLSGGLTATNVGVAIRRVHPWAVDVSSGVEIVGPDGKPVKGIKDPVRIAAFIEEVRNADG